MTSTTHKTLRGPASGMILSKEKFGAAIDKVGVSGSAGRPAGAHHRGKGGVFPGGMLLKASATISGRFSQMRGHWLQSLQEEGYRVVSGGTDSHMCLVDVFAKGVRGKEAEKALDEAYITANKNAIPFDSNPPLNPSGIRLGSPAVTTRGFRAEEMREVGRLIALVLNDVKSEQVRTEARKGVRALTDRFPLYAWKGQTATV